MKKQLFATAGTTLVEASPLDPKWGIGLEGHDSRARLRDSWPGRNLLGEILTEIREELLQVENGSTQRDQNSDIPGSGSDLDRYRSSSRDDMANSHTGSRSDHGGASRQGHGQSASDHSGRSKHTSSLPPATEFSTSGDRIFSRKPGQQLHSSGTHVQNEDWSDTATGSTAVGQRQTGNAGSKTLKSTSEKNFRESDKNFKPDSNVSSQISGEARTAGVAFQESGKSGKFPEPRVPSNEPCSLSKGWFNNK